jgi:hypothetical protein
MIKYLVNKKQKLSSESFYIEQKTGDIDDHLFNSIKQEHCITTEQSLTSPLVLKIRRDSLTTTTTTAANSSIG